MSPVLDACLAFTTGLALGAEIGVMALTWWQKRRFDPRVEGDLSEEDREAIAAGFKVHAMAVSRQVTEYADVLAGDDVVLRARLRQVEQQFRAVS